MMMRAETCRECGCDIQVAPYSPWDGTEQPTGCAASGWHSEACRPELTRRLQKWIDALTTKGG
jgi:hypothetical protein